MNLSFQSKALPTYLRLGGVGVALVLSACGGSGSSSSVFSISGVTSTGAALSGASVEARCSNGTTGNTTSSTDGKGTFKVTVTGGTLPCMLRSSGTDSNGSDIVLHSIADKGTTTTNVTPLTELVVAAATGAAGGSTPSDAFAKYSSDSTTQSTLSTEKLTYAKTVAASAVNAAATSGGQTVDLTNVDPMSSPFAVGNENDKKIDDLVTALKKNAASAQIADLMANLSITVAAATQANPTDPNAASAAASTKASEMVIKPIAINNCPAARNVPYRLVGISGVYGLSATPIFGANGNTGSISIAWSDNSTETSTVSFNAVSACKFTTANQSTGAFAPSGVFFSQYPKSSTSYGGISIGFPEQKIALSELTGTWNSVEYSRDGSSTGPWQNFQSLMTIDASGNINSYKKCTGSSADTNSCIEQIAVTSTAPKITTNTNGGFDITQADANRAFAFRTSAGALMLTISYPSTSGGGLIIATKQATLTNLAKGYTTAGYSAYANYASTIPSGFNSYVISITDSSPTSNTWTRSLFNDIADNYTVTEMLNLPRTGFRSRPSVIYTPTGISSPVTSTASVQLPITGTGVVATISTGTGAPNSTGPFPFLTLAVNASK